MVYIGFSTPTRWNILSWAIRQATGSRTSHAWMLVDDPFFKLRLVLEAHSTGFRLVTLEKFAGENRIVTVAIPRRPLDDAMPVAGNWLGNAFDARGLAGMAWVLLNRLLHLRKKRNPFRSARALFCSESVVRTLKAAGYPGAEALPEEDTTPQDLLDFLVRDGCTFVDPASLMTRPLTREQRQQIRDARVEDLLVAPPPAVERAA